MGEVQAPVAPRSLGWVRIEDELATPSAARAAGVEVLDDEDTVADVEQLRDLEGARRVLGRNRAETPGVAAGERELVVDEPVRHVIARAGLAGRDRLRLEPVPLQPV